MRLKNLIHPNRISFYGVGLTTTGVCMLTNPYTNEIGAGLVVLGSIMDNLDGRVARKYDMNTQEGARIDSFFDKIKNAAVGGYIVAREAALGNVLLPTISAANVVSDFLWQRQRGPYSKQIPEAVMGVYDPDKCTKDCEANSSIRANKWGKAKTGIHIGVGLFYIGRELLVEWFGEWNQFINDGANYVMAGALATSLTFCTIGGYKRLKKGREIRANEKRESESEREMSRRGKGLDDVA